MASTEQTTKVELLAWLDAKRRHVAQQFEALAPEDRRRSHVASGWTPRGLLHHLATDVERVWLRAVMAGEDVSLPSGYDGWVAAEDESDEQVLAAYVEEARLATRAVEGLGLDSRPVWWFPGEGSPPYGSLREVLLHVLVETATHAGHLDVCCELASGAQRLVLDEPPA